MNPRIYTALARTVVLESLRRKDLWVVAILGFIIILTAGTLGFFGFDGLEIFAKDLAVTVLGLFSTILAILTSSRLLPDEIKNRTLYPLLARPITRGQLLAGKLLGAVLVSWIAFLILAALTALALLVFKVKFEPIMLQYLFGKMMGLVVVCALSMTLSAYMTPSAGATMSFVFAFGSSMISRALVMGYDSAPEAIRPVFQLISVLLPQVSLFDMGGRVVNINWGPVQAWVMWSLFGYMLLYSSATMALGWVKFRKQAV